MSPLGRGRHRQQPLGPDLLLVSTIMFLRSEIVYPDNFWLLPTPWRTAPATWILLTSLLISLLTNGTDLIGFSIVPLVRCNVLDATMTMLTVVPLHKAIHPTSNGIQVAKSTAWTGLPQGQVEVPQMELKNADRPGWAQMTTGLPMDMRPDPQPPQDFWSALTAWITLVIFHRSKQ